MKYLPFLAHPHQRRGPCACACAQLVGKRVRMLRHSRLFAELLHYAARRHWAPHHLYRTCRASVRILTCQASRSSISSAYVRAKSANGRLRRCHRAVAGHAALANIVDALGPSSGAYAVAAAVVTQALASTSPTSRVRPNRNVDRLHTTVSNLADAGRRKKQPQSLVAANRLAIAQSRS